MTFRWNARSAWRLLALAGMMGLGLSACSRVRAEYYYLRLITTSKSASPELVHWSMKLEWMDAAGAIPPLIRLLHNEDSVMRAWAADSLRKHGGGTVLEALTEAARTDPDEQVRRSAIHSLGVIADPRSVSVLREMIGKQGGVYEALARLGPNGRDALLQATEQADPGQVADALRTVCQSFPEDPLVRRATERALGAKAEEVRSQAATCVGEMLGSDAVPLLAKCLEDASAEVRVAAGEQLARLGRAAGKELLISILRNHQMSDEVRMEAAQAIGRIKDLSAIGVLRDALHDPSLGVRAAAQRSLVLMLSSGDPRAYDDVSASASTSPSTLPSVHLPGDTPQARH